MLWTNATKEAIRIGKEIEKLKKLLQNNDKSSKMHYRLISIISGVYATRHVTHSIIY